MNNDELLVLQKSHVYVFVNKGQQIIQIEGEYSLPEDLTDWILIDEGYGDKYNLAQTHYFDKPLITQDGIYQYKLVGTTPVERSEKEIAVERETKNFTKNQQDKLTALSTACSRAITNGMDVETTEGAEHFSLEETDQINLTTALSAIEQGAKGYPYHADKKLCRMFTAVEIKAIAEKATAHKLYHTTLCNHLLILARRVTTTAELDKITYSADCLPLDLAQNMQKVLAASGVTE